jgi:hypothetical protein
MGEQAEWELVKDETSGEPVGVVNKEGQFKTLAEHLAPIPTPLTGLEATVPSPAEVLAAPEGELAAAPAEKAGPEEQPGVAAEPEAAITAAPTEAFPPLTEPVAVPAPPALPPVEAAPSAPVPVPPQVAPEAGPIKPPVGPPEKPKPAPPPAEPAAKADASSTVAEKVQQHLATGQRLDLKHLRSWMDEASGGTQAQGAWDSSDMNEAVEVALNRASLAAVESNGAPPNWPVKEARRRAVAIDNAISKTPTQTRRTDEKVAFQQFSTPPDYAMAAAWAANIGPRDVVLEPSAGTGSLAAWAGKKAIVNELSERRRRVLENMGFARVFAEDAEQLDNILPADVKPTVILMNPPFSAAGQRGVKKDITIGAGHVFQALKRLEPGGRLVAIVGRGMGMDAPAFRSWWENIAQNYNVRANIGVSGDVYAKYGTNFATRVLVIDKTGPTTGTIVRGEVGSIPDLISALEEVRGARAGQAERPAQPVGGAEAARPGGAPRPVQPAAPEPGGMAARPGRPGRPTKAGGGVGRPARQPEPEGEGRPEPAAGGHAPVVPGRGPAAGGAAEPGEAAEPAGKAGGAAGAEPGGGPPPAGAGELAPAGAPAPDAEPGLAPPEGYGASNTFFTQDAAARARARIKARIKGTTLTAGFDPELMLDGLTLSGFHIEAGARKFADYAKAMLGDLGEAIRPYLSNWYEAVRTFPGFDNVGMTPPDEVQRILARERVGEFLEAKKKEEEAAAPPADPKLGTTLEEDRLPEPTSAAAEQTKQAISSDDVFEVYAPPKLTVKGAKPHPTALVESAAMASVKAPELTYKSKLPQALIDAGELSDVQLEAISYAGQVHQRLLQDDQTRRGYFIGDGCVAAGTRLYDPITGQHNRIEDLLAAGRPHFVLALTQDGFRPTLAMAPFLKGTADLYRVELDDGRAITVTDEHRFLTPSGWRRLADGLRPGHSLACAEGLPECSSAVARSVRGEDARRWLGRPEDCLDDCDPAVADSDDARPRSAPGSDLASAPWQGGVHGHSHCDSHVDGQEPSPGHSHRYPPSGHRSRSSSSPWESLCHEPTSGQAVGTLSRSGTEKPRVSWLFPVEIAPLQSPAAAADPHRSEIASGSLGPWFGAPRPSSSEHTRSLAVSRRTAQQGRSLTCRTDSPLPSAQADQSGRLSVPSALKKRAGWQRIVSIAFVRRDVFYDLYVPGPENYLAEGIVNHNTGVGKGRQNAGIIMDNWVQGRKKAVWFSQSQKLYQDALRDWTALGGDGGDLFNLSKSQAGSQVQAKQGVMYVTYKTLSMGADFQTNGDYHPTGTSRGKWDIAKGDQVKIPQSLFETGRESDWAHGTIVSEKPTTLRPNPTFKVKLADGRIIEAIRPFIVVTKPAGKTVNKARIDQIVNWLGPDFDGVIVFDESHLMGNAVPIKGKMGTKDPSQIAMAGVALQQKFPKARVVYASATGATEVANLSYAVRLGLWGEGTAFPTRMDFINKISAGGVAAMEFVARDLKAQGSYLARGLNMKGVAYERLEHTITPDQTEIYDKLADAWQIVLKNINQALEDTGQMQNSRAKAAARSAFWGANQRFWNQILISMQSPSMIQAIEADLKAGHAPVLQLVNTNEAQTERALDEQSDEEVLDLDLTPRDILIQLIEKSYPTQQYEEHVDQNGKPFWTPVFDSEGKPVQNREAVEAKAKLIDELSSIRTPLAPLEMIFQAFGAGDIAEATGRSRRIEFEAGKQVVKPRTPAMMASDIADFQADRKKMIIFSDAGGTGASYHADLGAKNQRLRRHYLVQAGWRADKAVQGFGRTHRTNQKQPPEYVLVTTDLEGQKRFISSIARRLAQLGALTKGQRQTTEGMFSERDNLESEYAELAVRSLIKDIKNGDLLPDISWQDVEQEMGLDNLIDPKTGDIAESKLPPVSRFLNRILSVRIARQNKYFRAFMERLEANVNAAAERGELDTGLQTINTVNAKKTRDVVVHTDPATGSEAHYLEIEAEVPRKRMTFKQVSGSQGFAVELKTGRIWAYGKERSHTDARTGQVSTVRAMQGPLSGKAVETSEFDDAAKWERVRDKKLAEAMWKELYAKTPASRPTKFHLMSGSLLPIWDRLPTSGQVVRMQLDNGETVLGRELSDRDLGPTLERLGVGVELPKLTPAEAVRTVTDGGATLTLANGWTIQSVRVAGEPRILVTGPDYRFEGELLPAGVFAETHQYRKRYFIPTGPQAEAAMTAVLKARPITKISYPARGAAEEVGEGGMAATEPGALPGETTPARRIARILGSSDPSDEAKEEREQIRTEIAKEIGRIAGPEVEVKLYDTLFAELGEGRGASIYGAFVGSPTGGIIAQALQDSSGERLSSEQLMGTARHEAIHYLREIGAIPEEQWRALEARAPAWRRIFGIDVDPVYRGLDEGKKNEEAIAKAYDAWFRGELKAGPAENGAMRLLKRIFAGIARGLGRALGLQSLPTAEAVLQAIERGEFAGGRQQLATSERAQARRTMLASTGLGPGTMTTPVNLREQMRQLSALNYGLLQKALAPGMRGKTGHVLDYFRRIFVDRFLMARRVQEAAEQALGRPLTDAEKVYLAEEGYYGKVGEHKFRLEKDYFEPITKLMHDSGVSREEVDEYSMAKHAPERNAKIASINPLFPATGTDPKAYGSGMTNDEAAAILASIPEAKRAALEEIHNLVRGMLEQRLDFMVQSGLIGADQAAAYRTTYQDYVPLRGVEQDPLAEDEDAMKFPTGRGFMGSRAKEKRAFGRTSRAPDVLATAMAMTDAAFVRGEKNYVARSLLRLVRAAPDPNVWSVNPLEREAYLAKDGTVKYRYRPHYSGQDTVSVRVGGKEFRIEIKDPLLLQALSNMGGSQLGPMLRTLAQITGTLSKLNTMWSPEFLVANAQMDFGTALVNLGREDLPRLRREVVKLWGPAFNGARHYVSTGKTDTEMSRWAQRFRRAGGATAFNQLTDVETMQKTVDDALKRLSRRGGGPLGALKTLGGAIEHLNTGIDNAVRLATFRVLVEKYGYSDARAMSVVKNLTINFNRKGELGPAFNAFFMFFNAGIQGTTVLLSAMMRSPKVRQFVVATIALGVVQELLAGAIPPPDDDKEGDGRNVYDRIKEWEKKQYMILPYGSGPGDYVKIRMPYGYALFHNIGRLMAAYVRGAQEDTGRPVSLAGTLVKLGSALKDNLVPPGIADTLIPTVAEPFWDLARNKDWLDRPIKPPTFPGDVGKPESQRYYPSVSPISRELSSFLNSVTGGNEFRPGLIDISPEAFSHVANTYAGAAGHLLSQMGTKLWSAGWEAAGGNVEDPKLSVWRDTPFVRKFFGDASPWQQRDVTYQRMGEIETLADEADSEDKAFAQKVRRENRRLLALTDNSRKLRRELGSIRKQRLNIKGNDKLPIAERRRRIDRLEQREGDLMTRFNRAYLRALRPTTAAVAAAPP